MLMAQRIATLAGYSFDLESQQELTLAAINSIFVVLAVIGIVSDPTVKGFADSTRALEYDAPHGGELVSQVEQVMDDVLAAECEEGETAEDIVNEVLGD
jgi:phi LC3 family holin